MIGGIVTGVACVHGAPARLGRVAELTYRRRRCAVRPRRHREQISPHTGRKDGQVGTEVMT